eukprot:g275.t1
MFDYLLGPEHAERGLLDFWSVTFLFSIYDMDGDGCLNLSEIVIAVRTVFRGLAHFCPKASEPVRFHSKSSKASTKAVGMEPKRGKMRDPHQNPARTFHAGTTRQNYEKPDLANLIGRGRPRVFPLIYAAVEESKGVDRFERSDEFFASRIVMSVSQALLAKDTLERLQRTSSCMEDIDGELTQTELAGVVQAVDSHLKQQVKGMFASPHPPAASATSTRTSFRRRRRSTAGLPPATASRGPPPPPALLTRRRGKR